MDNAVATALPTPLVPSAEPGTPGVAARWQAMPVRTQLGALFGLAALIAVLAFMFIGARDSDFRPLFPQLSEKDGGQVIGPLGADGRALQVRRRRQRHPGAQRPRARTAHEAGGPGPALGRCRRWHRGRLRAAGQEQLRPDPGPGTHEGAARHRRRADHHHPGPGIGEVGACAPGAAAAERLLPRTAEAQRLRRADAAPRPHARPQPDRRHRARGLGQRARTVRPRP